MYAIDHRVKSAYNLARAAHIMQQRVTGEPYINHVERVSKMVSRESTVVALLHDVLEDNQDARVVASPGIPPYWRLCLGVCQVALTTTEAEALMLITRSKNETYSTYIGRLVQSGNNVAIEVKLADLTDNLETLPESLESLRERYVGAVSSLMGTMEPEEYVS